MKDGSWVLAAKKTEQNQFWAQVATDGDNGNRTFSNNFPSQSSMTGTLHVLKSLQGNYLRPHPHSDEFHAPRTSLTKAGLLQVHCERFVLRLATGTGAESRSRIPWSRMGRQKLSCRGPSLRKTRYHIFYKL